MSIIYLQWVQWRNELWNYLNLIISPSCFLRITASSVVLIELLAELRSTLNVVENVLAEFHWFLKQSSRPTNHKFNSEINFKSGYSWPHAFFPCVAYTLGLRRSFGGRWGTWLPYPPQDSAEGSRCGSTTHHQRMQRCTQIPPWPTAFNGGVCQIIICWQSSSSSNNIQMLTLRCPRSHEKKYLKQDSDRAWCFHWLAFSSSSLSRNIDLGSRWETCS